MYSSVQSSTIPNIVAITGGHSQLNGVSKDEFPKWQRSLRILLNSLRCLDTDSGDKIRAVHWNVHFTDTYRSKVYKVSKVFGSKQLKTMYNYSFDFRTLKPCSIRTPSDTMF